VDYIGKDNLEIMEEMAPFYNKYLASRFKKIHLRHRGNETSAVLDFGAGIGSLAVELKKIGFTDIDCLEIDQRMHKTILQRGFSAYSSIESLPQTYSFVYMSNVLEHIQNDQQVLREIQTKVLDWNGTLVVYVPAFNLLFSKLDVQVGHFRRYRKSSIVPVIERSGFTVEKCEYVDSIGFITLLILKLFFGKNLSLSQNKKLVGIYDKYFFPVSQVLDRLGLRRVLGKNLLLVAKKSH
jgi:hypothetical protein